MLVLGNGIERLVESIYSRSSWGAELVVFRNIYCYVSQILEYDGGYHLGHYEVPASQDPQ